MKKKNIAYLFDTLNFWHLRICAVRRELNFWAIIPIIFIDNSLCSLEHDLYIVKVVCVFPDYIR